jgi:hypothetical protein
MKYRLRFQYGLCAAASRCWRVAQKVPTAPLPELRVPRSVQDEQVSRSIAKHRQLAKQYKAIGRSCRRPDAMADPCAAVSTRRSDSVIELEATESSIDRRAREHIAAGSAALRSGDIDRAGDSLLKALALDPDNAEAATMLREVEKATAVENPGGSRSKGQCGGGSTVRRAATAAAASAPAAPPGNGFDLELPLEIFKAGDTAGGLRDLRRYVDANPNDRAGRQRIGVTSTIVRVTSRKRAPKSRRWGYTSKRSRCAAMPPGMERTRPIIAQGAWRRILSERQSSVPDRCRAGDQAMGDEPSLRSAKCQGRCAAKRCASGAGKTEASIRRRYLTSCRISRSSVS